MEIGRKFDKSFGDLFLSLIIGTIWILLKLTGTTPCLKINWKKNKILELMKDWFKIMFFFKVKWKFLNIEKKKVVV